MTEFIFVGTQATLQQDQPLLLQHHLYYLQPQLMTWGYTLKIKYFEGIEPVWRANWSEYSVLGSNQSIKDTAVDCYDECGIITSGAIGNSILITTIARRNFDFPHLYFVSLK